MTDATPLASEQINEDDCPYCAGHEEVEARVADGSTDYIPCPHPCHRIAALSASPAPSGALHDHVRKMQEACANYIEPTTYIARHPDTSKIGDCAWVREFPMPNQHASAQGAAETNARRDQAFIRDMIYMLDGPEQRAAMSPAPSGQGVSGEVAEKLRSLVPDDFANDESGEHYALVNYTADILAGPATSCTPALRSLDGRECTCHPDDRPEECQRRFAASECQRAAPAPSCAPAGVGKALGLLRDYIHAAGGDADHEAILDAALSPQGLDAKEGGE